MKTKLTLRFLFALNMCVCICQILPAQIRLDVEGDAKIRGKLDITASPTDETSLFIGQLAGLNDDGTGNRNTFIGVFVGRSTTEGYDNTAVGNSALLLNTTGYTNTAVGTAALYYNTAGYYNTTVGRSSLLNNTTGNSNNALGYSALANNTTGTNNTGIGNSALFYNVGGYYNTAVGNYSGSASATSNRCTFLGYDADQSTGNPYTNSTAIGYMARISASNQIRLGDNSVTSIGGFVAWTNLSDGRFKRNLKEDVPGLNFILKLRPITFNLDAHGLAAHLQEDRVEDVEKENGINLAQGPDSLTLKGRDEKGRIRYTGFIAQEVEKVAQEIGYDFSGVDKPTNEESLYGLRYAEFTVPLVKAVQEQQEMLEKQEVRIKSQEAKLIEVESLNEKLRMKNEELEIRLAKLEALLQPHTGASGTQAIENQQSKIVIPTARLEQNQPNPFEGTTTIRYSIPKERTKAEIQITNAEGKVIQIVLLEAKGEGQIELDATALNTGSYFYSLMLDGQLIETRQMVLAK